jgi:prepilin-type N-terminal cleavage/methylation domain-containing protein
MRHRRGFTVPEMLAVVAIIVIILSILLPNLNRARAHARLAICLSNQHQLSIAWRGYAVEQRQRLMGAHTARPDYDWVENTAAPILPTNETADAIKNGTMYPFVNDLAVYKCPDDPRTAYLRTYSMSNYVGGDGWDVQAATRLSGMPMPSRTLLLIEEPDYRGYNWGSWVINPKYSGAKDQWIDWAASYHFREGCTLSFADGRSEYWKWQDSRTPTIQDFYATTPGNADLIRLQDVYTPTP